MKYIIYLIYPLMAGVLFWGAKTAKRGEWNEEAFSLRQTKALQGFFAICIMLHHIGQKTCASWLSPWLIMPGLELFVPYGYYFVGIFLFCSGYGLYVSYKKKPNYLKDFGRRKVLPLVIAFYVTGLIFLLVRILLKEPLNAWKVFCYASGLQLSDPNAWFMIALPFFYLFFWISFRFCKKEGAAAACLSLFIFGYVLLGTLIDHNDYWMRGEWWYNSAHFFVIGVLFGMHEERIKAHFRKHYVIYLVLLTIGVLALDLVSTYAQGVFSYYGETWGAPDKVFRRWVTLLTQVLASCAFVFWVFLLGMKIRIGNRFLYFMGTITMEFYLIHGLFLGLFSYDFDGVARSLYYLKNVPLLVLLTFVPSLPASLLIQKLDHLILGLFTKKPSSDASAAVPLGNAPAQSDDNMTKEG